MMSLWVSAFKKHDLVLMESYVDYEHWEFLASYRNSWFEQGADVCL